MERLLPQAIETNPLNANKEVKMTKQAKVIAEIIFEHATPFLKIKGIKDVDKKWCRNVKLGDSRRGPWLSADYEVLSLSTWNVSASCLYMVKGNDGCIRYVGISKNRLKDRWRLSPAYDETLIVKLPDKQLFHSQCWRKIEDELTNSRDINFEARVIFSEKLKELYKNGAIPLDCPLSLETFLRKKRIENRDIKQGFLTWNAI